MGAKVNPQMHGNHLYLGVFALDPARTFPKRHYQGYQTNEHSCMGKTSPPVSLEGHLLMLSSSTETYRTATRPSDGLAANNHRERTAVVHCEPPLREPLRYDVLDVSAKDSLPVIRASEIIIGEPDVSSEPEVHQHDVVTHVSEQCRARQAICQLIARFMGEREWPAAESTQSLTRPGDCSGDVGVVLF